MQDRILLFLVIAILFLLVLAFFFGIYAILLRMANNRKAARWRRLESLWEQTILEVMEEEQPPEALWKKVRPPDILYFVDFLLRYARRLRGREWEILCELARPYLRRIADHITKGEPERRARAVQTLSGLGFREYTGFLLRALDDPSPLVAMIAARSLIRKEHPEYIEKVLVQLHRFHNWSPGYLASLLASIGSAAAPELRRTLTNPQSSPYTRAVAAEALRRLNDFTAADAAANILQIETNRDLLAASLRLLTQTGRPEHLPAIRPLCESPDYVVRAQAVRALGCLGEKEDGSRLVKAFDDPSPWVAMSAAWSLRIAGRMELLNQLAASDHSRSNLARQVLAEEPS
jgi:HEAT repeat protein